VTLRFLVAEKVLKKMNLDKEIKNKKNLEKVKAFKR
jgi:hypothetical protein